MTELGRLSSIVAGGLSRSDELHCIIRRLRFHSGGTTAGEDGARKVKRTSREPETDANCFGGPRHCRYSGVVVVLATLIEGVTARSSGRRFRRFDAGPGQRPHH